MTSNLSGEVDHRFPIRQVQTKTGAISYRESGNPNDKVIILLHGIGSGSGSWFGQLDKLSADYHVIAWDAPGYGSSVELLSNNPSADDYAEELINFLNILKIEPYIIIGHSLGALIAGAYAAKNATIGLVLILANPANGYGNLNKAERDKKLSVRLERMEALGPKGLAEARSSVLLSDNATNEALELVRWNMSMLSVSGHSQAAHMLARANLMVDAAKYAGPVLVVCGSADAVIPETAAKNIAAAYPNGQYKTLPNVGHASYVEDPTLFNYTIINFVDSLNEQFREVNR